VERALNESELRFRSLIENASDVISIIGADGAIRFVSPALKTIAGFGPEEVIGRSFFDVIHPDDVAATRAVWTGLAASPGGSQPLTMRLLRKDGSIRETESVVRNLLDTPGVNGIVLSTRDVTERHRSEEALRVSHQLLQGILDSITVRVFWKDRNLVYRGCNKAFAHDAGFGDSKDVVGKDDRQMVWRDQADAYAADDRQVIDAGRPKMLYEEPQTTPDGKRITLLTSKIPLLDAKGRIDGVLGTYLDITALRQAEAALQASERKYRELIRITRDAMVSLDPSSGMFTTGNPAAIALFGARDEPDLLAHSLSDLCPERQPDGRLSADKSREMIETALRQGSHFFEWTHRRINGSEIPVDVLLTRVDIDGRILLHATVRDITDR
jgi:PAS domain S-box-containing protein